MSALAALQSRFLRDLQQADDAVANDVHGTPAFSVSQRLAVYRNAYRRRLVEALAAVYERTVRVLGADAFDAHALAYVEGHPPADRALGRYGLDFPDWLRGRGTQADGARLALAADVAVIDGQLRRAFDAADATPVPREALLALPLEAWATLRFRWDASLGTDSVVAAAIEGWREPASVLARFADGAAKDVPSDTAMTLRVPVAFWRRDGQTFFRSLAPDEALLLIRLRQGVGLAEACGGDSESAVIPLETAAPALLSWIDEGWVAALLTANPE
jgi:hypothetical protein